jgi:hypothetical protein
MLGLKDIQLADLILSEKGGVIVTGGSYTGSYQALYALENSSVDLDESNLSGLISGVPLAAGDYLYGKITEFTVASGKVVAYNR